jgi:hypothetical protein
MQCNKSMSSYLTTYAAERGSTEECGEMTAAFAELENLAALVRGMVP